MGLATTPEPPEPSPREPLCVIQLIESRCSHDSTIYIRAPPGPLPGVAGVRPKRAFTLEDIYRVASIGGLQVSPDGARVAYTITTSDLPHAKRATHIWLMDLASGSTRQLTRGDTSEGSPVFSPDGKSLLFVTTRAGGSNLYVMPLDGGEARPLTHVSTGVSDPVWSPDGKWIAFSTDVYPECGADDACNSRIADRWHDGRLQAHMADALLYRHWTAWKDGTRTHIFLANADTGAARDLTPGDVDSPPFQLGGPVHTPSRPTRPSCASCRTTTRSRRSRPTPTSGCSR